MLESNSLRNSQVRKQTNKKRIIAIEATVFCRVITIKIICFCAMPKKLTLSCERCNTPQALTVLFLVSRSSILASNTRNTPFTQPKKANFKI
jgi:hypothetical protein